MENDEKRERLIEAASAVLNVAPNRRLNAVVLNKALFYLDLASLRDHAATVTSNTFIGLPQGPVVAKYPQRLIGELESRGIAKQVSEWDGSKPILLKSIPQHFQFLDADALNLVAAVTSYFANVTSRQASDFAHDNPGWQLAWNECRRTGRPCAVNMRVAMQQIIEDDPWMDSPLLNDDEMMAAADGGVGVDW
jgi:hypothetical protein